jgi:hypothetical protein
VVPYRWNRGSESWLSDVSFSVTYPRSVDRDTVRVYGGPNGTLPLSTTCGYVVDGPTVSGFCESLRDSGVSVAVAVGPGYFCPTAGQTSVLVLSPILLLLLIALLVDFSLQFLDLKWEAEIPDFHPAVMGRLVNAQMNSKVVLLYRAWEGELYLTGDENGAVSFRPVTSVPESGIRRWHLVSLSGVNRDSEASVKWIPFNDIVGFDAAVCFLVPILCFLLAFASASAVLSEFLCVYRTLAQPLISGVIRGLIPSFPPSSTGKASTHYQSRLSPSGRRRRSSRDS